MRRSPWHSVLVLGAAAAAVQVLNRLSLLAFCRTGGGCLAKSPPLRLERVSLTAETCDEWSTLVGLRRTRAARSRLCRGASPPSVQERQSTSWVLPSVDKDVGDFHQVRGPGFAMVQTSETLYIFAPMPEGFSDPPDVILDLQNEGSYIRFVVEGKDVLKGNLAHSVKPGNQIWMIEDAPDGTNFAVVEMDKQTLGIEWTSVMRPEVSILKDYSKPVVELSSLSAEDEAATVDDTLKHLQNQRSNLQRVADGAAAARGNVLTLDMQGYELNADGTRGKTLEIGSAKDLRLDLGGAGFTPEVHESLVGIGLGETRDAQVTLGRRAGAMGGQRIICAITCNKIEEQSFPELNDEFARQVKRDEQFKQAGTMEGIPDEEEGLAKVITLQQLKEEIAREVRQTAEEEGRSTVKAQLQLLLKKAAEVRCDWAILSPEAIAEEELANIISAIAHKEGLAQKLDQDAINRETWDELGTPDAGESQKEVGKDPAREFQASHRKVLRKRTTNAVLNWLEERMTFEDAEGQ
ncbi:unnamed protein product [Polarella glacialis]|uniref:CS domain-containing protein n=2 Tax=Polarella glacialis TaxID=89957 RepID=A0A813HEW8_POLGL|nr:unnamed protein product [Polarella glacialis]CAE8636136.1 unnamed protein product [Polarella glacialis]|mmetsp:Transcript_7181/g.13500  ORF Transcript_7181/g.13500 Transcript_7181/m.13500 type:complete len:521 (+) Transcript_7181:97-1659(+)